MQFWEILLIAFGLCMDTFALAMSCGMARQNKREKLKLGLKIALIFGFCQAMALFLGWLAGQGLKQTIMAFDHWVAFIILGLVGGNMIREAVEIKNEKECKELTIRTLFTMGVATSIDALAVGVSFGVGEVPVALTIFVTFIITAGVATIGFGFGDKIGKFLEHKAEIFGGLILIGIGVKILLEHLFFA